MRFWSPSRKFEWIETYTISGKKCRPMILFSGDIKFMRIFAGISWWRGVKRQWSCRQRQFSLFLLTISSKTLEIRPVLRYCTAIRSPSSALQWSENAWSWMTLLGYLALNSVFAPVCPASDCATFENNCVKTNKDRHIRHTQSAAQIFDRESIVSGSIRFVQIFAQVLQKRSVKGQWGRALTLVYSRTPCLSKTIT